jgi:hypothetical protein
MRPAVLHQKEQFHDFIQLRLLATLGTCWKIRGTDFQQTCSGTGPGSTVEPGLSHGQPSPCPLSGLMAYLFCVPDLLKALRTIPSGAAFRNRYTTATFCKGPGMRPMPGLLRSTFLRPWPQHHVTWPSGGQHSYGRTPARTIAARQTPQVTLKSPYSVWIPSRENLRQLSLPLPAPQVV